MKSKFPQLHGARPKTAERAKELRKNQTTTEKRMWEIIRGRKIKNIKFRRQHPVGHFIVDFYCHEEKLVLEIDGPVHDLAHVQTNDIKRQKYIESKGLNVLRIKAKDVYFNPEFVVNEIIKTLNTVSKPS